MLKGILFRATVLVTVIGSLVGAPSVAQALSPSTILAAWTDSHGRSVFVRVGGYNGTTGYGWMKIQIRHNIHSIASLQYVSRAPDGGVQQGYSRLYTAYANRKVCYSNGVCRVTDSIPVRVVMNNSYQDTYYGYAVYGALGIQTAYCVSDAGTLDCPSWVDAGLSHVITTTPGQPSVQTEWSYTPENTAKN